MAVSHYDKSGKQARKDILQLFRGRRGKEFRSSLMDLIRDRQALTGGESMVGEQLSAGGFYNQLLSDASGMRDSIAQVQPLIARAAQGQFFDMAPIQAAAERNFQRTTGPGFFESRFAGGPYSSGFAEGFGQQARDMNFDLAALGADMNYQAQRDLAFGGGLGQFLEAQRTPYQFTGQGLENLLGLGGAYRTSLESTRQGAAPLVPTFYEGPFQSLAGVEQNARIRGQESSYTGGGQAGGWFK